MKLKSISYILCFLFSFSVCFSQTTPLTFTTIANDYLRPGAGAMNWNDLYQIPIPPGGATGVNAGLDRYIRFAWNQVQNDNGTYNFAALDIRINLAIANGQSFSLGIMPYIEGGNGTTINGGTATFPTYLYTLMAAENPISVWKSPVDGYWIPNVNSPNYITEWNKLMVAIANHINSTSSGGVPYSKIIFYHDIRGYGNFGEWHNFPYDQQAGWPAYFWPTAASLDTIIENYKRIYPKNHLVMLLGAFASGGDSHVPLEVTYRLLTSQNGAGYIGWRRDNWGDEVNYSSILENNPNSFNGLAFKTQIMSQWQRAIITGEPLNGPPASPTYSALSTEMIRYGGTSYGNGNVTNPNDATIIANMQSGSKTSGARLQFPTGSISTTITQGGTFALTLNWQNIGVAPIYEKWNPQFELRNTVGTTVFQTWTSIFTPKLFLPGNRSVTDNLTLTGTIAAGTYNLYLIIRDSSGYRKPYPLSQTGQLADGSYLIKGNLIITAAGNSPPISHPGGGQTILLPTNSVSLIGGGTPIAPATSITSFIWTKVSGPAAGTITTPNAANTTITGLVQGVYVFNLKVTDNNGLIGNATIQITVNQKPTVSAGTNQTLLLPTNSTTLLGTATAQPGGSISSMTWVKTSGPAAGVIATPTAATTTITGLVQGVYVFTFTATDNNGNSNSASVTITVNQRPTANAGSPQTITLPVNTVTLTGSGTAQPGGSITTFAWIKTSGPAGGTITTPAAATTTVTGLIQGTYVFTLTVTDNNGNTGTSTVTITVRPPNQKPTANAGTPQTIQLPVTTVTLTGSGTFFSPATSITNYAWSKTSGPATFVITSPTSATTTVTGLTTVGTYVFTLVVTDNLGQTGTATVTITVNAANVPPTANAGVNQTITLPTNSVTLTGSGTFFAPATSITTYAWVKTVGPAATITSPSSATTTVTGLVQGSYVFQLTVTDNNGLTGSKTMTVTVNAAPVPPTSNAGSPQTITLPTSTVSLTGSGTFFSPATSITNFSWTKTSGPATGTITSPTSASTTVTNLTIAGTYVFTLIVTDNNGLTGSSTVTITVNPAPLPPTTNAGSPQTIQLPVNSVTLTGSGTPHAPATSITTYHWVKTSGPATFTIVSPNASTTIATGLVQGAYIFTLTVTDNNGLTGTSTVTITVNAANVPPTSNAGSPQTITLPTSTVTLNGSGTPHLPATSIITYAWTKTSGPATFTIVSPSAATTNITGLTTAGTYVFTLTVTDNNGQTGISSVTITVNPPNTPPTSNAGSPQTITLPTSSVTVNGVGTPVLPATSITTYAWTKTAGPATFTITSPASATTTITGLVQGTYIFTLTVTDNNGLTGTSNVTITVNAAPQNPTANAGPDQTITLPVSSVTLSGSGMFFPPAASITYTWTKTAGPATFTITSPNAASTTVTGLIQGTYTFTLTVTDNNGLTGINSINIIVNHANLPPTSNPGTSQTIQLPVNTLTLNGSGTPIAPATSITNYSWVQTFGPIATIATPTSASTLITFSTQGTYIFSLTVTDNNGLTGTNSVTVIVSAANPNPIANAGSNQSITLPINNTVLSGSGTALSPAISIASYLWTKVSGPASFNITTPTAATTVVTALLQGVYTFNLQVTDNNGLHGNSTMTVTVNAAIIPPTVSAGSNQTVTLPDTATLTGTATPNSPATSITTYLWSYVSGPTGSILLTPNAPTTKVAGLTPGVFTFMFTATDNLGVINTGTMQLTVNPPIPSGCNCGEIVYNKGLNGTVIKEVDGGNRMFVFGRKFYWDSLPNCKAPNINAPNYTVTLPIDQVKVSVTATSNNSHGISSYAWTQVSGNTATILNQFTSIPTIANLTGTAIFNVFVRDSCGGKGNKQITITVNPVPILTVTNAVGVYSHFLWWKWLTGVTLTYSNGNVITLSDVSNYIWNGKTAVVFFKDGATKTYP